MPQIHDTVSGASWYDADASKYAGNARYTVTADAAGGTQTGLGYDPQVGQQQWALTYAEKAAADAAQQATSQYGAETQRYGAQTSRALGAGDLYSKFFGLPENYAASANLMRGAPNASPVNFWGALQGLAPLGQSPNFGAMKTMDANGTVAGFFGAAGAQGGGGGAGSGAGGGGGSGGGGGGDTSGIKWKRDYHQAVRDAGFGTGSAAREAANASIGMGEAAAAHEIKHHRNPYKGGAAFAAGGSLTVPSSPAAPRTFVATDPLHFRVGPQPFVVGERSRDELVNIAPAAGGGTRVVVQPLQNPAVPVPAYAASLANDMVRGSPYHATLPAGAPAHRYPFDPTGGWRPGAPNWVPHVPHPDDVPTAEISPRAPWAIGMPDPYLPDEGLPPERRQAQGGVTYIGLPPVTYNAPNWPPGYEPQRWPIQPIQGAASGGWTGVQGVSPYEPGMTRMPLLPPPVGVDLNDYTGPPIPDTRFVLPQLGGAGGSAHGGWTGQFPPEAQAAPLSPIGTVPLTPMPPHPMAMGGAVTVPPIALAMGGAVGVPPPPQGFGGIRALPPIGFAGGGQATVYGTPRQPATLYGNTTPTYATSTPNTAGQVTAPASHGGGNVTIPYYEGTGYADPTQADPRVVRRLTPMELSLLDSTSRAQHGLDLNMWSALFRNSLPSFQQASTQSAWTRAS
jgi:hypothetical protein